MSPPCSRHRRPQQTRRTKLVVVRRHGDSAGFASDSTRGISEPHLASRASQCLSYQKYEPSAVASHEIRSSPSTSQLRWGPGLPLQAAGFKKPACGCDTAAAALRLPRGVQRGRPTEGRLTRRLAAVAGQSGGGWTSASTGGAGAGGPVAGQRYWAASRPNC